ncbi:MAG: transaldolase [Acidobacteria bacterium]|nr:transaldolase [Acidobacteriota bacterium]
MSQNPLQRLAELGQSVWYDYIRRDLYQGPELRRLIDEDGLRGMTSNPTIFQQAIAATELYDDDIRRLGEQGLAAEEIFESLAVEDVSRVADAFRQVYETNHADDGFVSIEVGPHLAMDTAGSIAEAQRLWKRCDRPNVMVKIPGTEPGVPAIRQCLAAGININVTLLFSVERYRAVMEAYLSALEERIAAGQPVDRLRSVASFFVSRVDTNVDKKLDAAGADASRPERQRQLARELRGKAAIANARLAYRAFEEVFSGERFARLREKGASRQRPLWASTSTKDPAYPDLYYVEALVAPDSIDTMPRETFDAYRDHGNPRVRIHDDLDRARDVLDSLAELGVDESQVYEQLEQEGIQKFSDSYDKLLKAVEEKEKAVRVS